jgi:hypothetical protein
MENLALDSSNVIMVDDLDAAMINVAIDRNSNSESLKMLEDFVAEIKRSVQMRQEIAQEE